MASILAEFSEHRLNGEPVPDDVKILLSHNTELKEQVAVELNWSPNWSPWLDTSYLSPEDWANPDIAANVKAIHEVCHHIAFIAMDEESQYYGFWRGPEQRSIAESPIVHLDNEGQFRLCAGSNFTEALFGGLADLYSPDGSEMRDWLRSIDVSLAYDKAGDVPYADAQNTPAQLHDELYRRYLM